MSWRIFWGWLIDPVPRTEVPPVLPVVRPSHRVADAPILAERPVLRRRYLNDGWVCTSIASPAAYTGYGRTPRQAYYRWWAQRERDL